MLLVVVLLALADGRGCKVNDADDVIERDEINVDRVDLGPETYVLAGAAAAA